MSLERLVVCSCGHYIEHHGAEGCSESRREVHCRCGRTRDAVVESLIALEKEAIRRQWARPEAV